MPDVIANLVSVIIPVHNRPEMLKSAVESVLAQSYRPLEVLISDDGSIDNTLNVAREMVDHYRDEVFLIENSHQGPGAAREAGRQRARGEYIQYLDSDDVLAPNKFEIQVQALKDHPECGVAYGRTRLVTLDGEVRQQAYKWTGEERPELFPGLLMDRWWCTHTPLYRRAVCDAVGAWSNLRYSQDWEYDARVGALRTKLVYCDDWVSDHRCHDQSRQTGHGKWLSAADQVLFFQSLINCGEQAEILKGASEWKHFSRWVFHHARVCGEAGHASVAWELLRLAQQSAAGGGGDIWLYRCMVRVLGWRKTASLASALGQTRAGQAGAQTQKLSWMKEDS